MRGNRVRKTVYNAARKHDWARERGQEVAEQPELPYETMTAALTANDGAGLVAN